MPGLGTLQAEQRLGHDVPAMRGLYTHGTQAMREDLTAALQARWETSLRDGPPSTRAPPSRPSTTARAVPHRPARRGGPPRPGSPRPDRRARASQAGPPEFLQARRQPPSEAKDEDGQVSL